MGLVGGAEDTGAGGLGAGSGSGVGAGGAAGAAMTRAGGSGAEADPGANGDSSQWKAPVSPEETDGAGARNSAGGACCGAEFDEEGGGCGACCRAVLHGDGGGSAGARGAVLHEAGGSAWPHGEGAVPGLLIGGNSDSGGPEDDRAGAGASSGGLKVVSGLRTRTRRPHESQNWPDTIAPQPGQARSLLAVA